MQDLSWKYTAHRWHCESLAGLKNGYYWYENSIKQAVTINGDIPRSDHFPPHPKISNNDFYFDIFFRKVLETPFSAENGAGNTKMNRGQETHPIRVNAWYVMNGINSFLQKVPETLFSIKYLATRGPKMGLGTWKCIGSRDSPHKGKC